MNNKTGRCCPICESDTKEKVILVDFELFEGHPMNGGYDLVQCTVCGFIYADTSVTQDQLDKYYTELSKYEDKTIATGGGYTKYDKDRLIDTAEFIGNKITNKNVSIVDLGCSNGGLLKELKNLGFNTLTGIDPSSECVNITKQGVGCDCYQHSLFDIPESVGKFDVVILTHVLEHLLDVRKAVTIIDGLLKPGGYVFIECPNAAFYKEVIHAPLQEFNAEHINHFTETSFRNLMGLFGFKDIYTSDKIFKIASDQDYHAVYGLFKKEDNPTFQLQFDTVIRTAIDEYINKSSVIFDGINSRLNVLPSGTTVALFGVGQFSFKLLKSDFFKKATHFKLFDNNRMNVGKMIMGIPILHGSTLLSEYKKQKFVIIISSLIHEVAIKNNIESIFNEDGEPTPEMIGFSSLL